MTQAHQGSQARHAAFTHSPGFMEMKRVRAEVGRDTCYQFEEREGNWHLVCQMLDCRQAITQVTKDGKGYVFRLSEVLTAAVGHHVERHNGDLERMEYGEDYA